jgi:hypothetical protein
MRNPFEAGFYNNRQTYFTTGSERLNQVKGFNLEQCEAGLQVAGLQVAVEKALNSRMKKLKGNS